jgi:hypothetical protein
MPESPVYKAVMDSLSETLARHGGGMPTGNYVLVAEILDSGGEHAMYVAGPESQPTHRSLGLLAYGHEFYGSEARIQILSCLDEE